MSDLLHETDRRRIGKRRESSFVKRGTTWTSVCTSSKTQNMILSEGTKYIRAETNCKVAIHALTQHN